jgi:hypothetical protein
VPEQERQEALQEGQVPAEGGGHPVYGVREWRLSERGLRLPEWDRALPRHVSGSLCAWDAARPVDLRLLQAARLVV